jgi:hypothetical protein
VRALEGKFVDLINQRKEQDILKKQEEERLAKIMEKNNNKYLKNSVRDSLAPLNGVTRN